MRLLAALALIALSPAAALAQDLPRPRPFDAMRGPCADFAMDISREAAIWSGAVVSGEASAQPGSGAHVGAAVLHRITLRPHGEVAFPVAPEQDRGAPDRFSGHVTLDVPEAGLWRVAASNGLWFDAVVEGAPVRTGAFEMQTQCQTPFKVVVFALPAGEVALQLNGSPVDQVDLVLLPWAAP